VKNPGEMTTKKGGFETFKSSNADLFETENNSNTQPSRHNTTVIGDGSFTFKGPQGMQKFGAKTIEIENENEDLEVY
jgi:hypothetical protein